MGNITYYLALMIVYFLLVYLTAIRRGGQQPLPWLLLVIVQTVSLYYFDPLRAKASETAFLAGAAPAVCTAAVAAALVIANLLLILLVNLLFLPRRAKAVAEADAFRLDARDLPGRAPDPVPQPFAPERVSAFPTPAPGPLPNASVPGSSEIPLASVTLPKSPAAPSTENGAEDRESEELLRVINKLVEDGQKEEAMKYLRMVAFFDKSESAAQKAKTMLAQLQTQEA